MNIKNSLMSGINQMYFDEEEKMSGDMLGSSAEGWLMSEVRKIPKAKNIFKEYGADGSYVLRYHCPYCDHESSSLEDRYCPQCGNLFAEE